MASVRAHRQRNRHWEATISLGRAIPATDDPGEPVKYVRKTVTLCPLGCTDSELHSQYPDRRVEGGKAGAVKLATAIELELKHSADRRRMHGSDDIAIIAERWLAEIEPDRAASTIDGYRAHVRTKINPRIGHRSIAEFRPSDVNDFFVDLRACGGANGQPMTPASIRRVRATLSGIFRYAVATGLRDSNPVREVSGPKVTPTKTDAPTLADVQAFRKALRSENLPWLSVLVDLAAYTGIRRSEALALTWGDIDLSTPATLRVVASLDAKSMHVGPTKTAHSRRTLELAPQVADVLREWRTITLDSIGEATGTRPDDVDPNWVVFHAAEALDRHRHPDSITTQIRRICERHGLPRMWLHGLRHFANSTMIGAGIDPVTVARYMGHSSAKLTLDVYSSPTLGHAAAVATVADLLQPEGPRGSQSDPLASMTTEELQLLRASIDERLGQRDGRDVTPAE